ncbi:hypothetical protein M885DRAFT_126022 [Pelagophyceae sp. CCMP2097]|nr:hypothetical protein M885DRAFT_126022 [Pelagophyceae sp. CCMP2097]
MEQAAKVAALAANDSARQQLTDLRAAFARAAAASADGRAAALAAAARESGMAASLAELSDLAASQKAELTRLRAARDAAKVRANAAVDELRACAAEAAQAQTRALGRDAKTLELEKHLTLLDAHLTTARADALQTSARLAANDADAARRADARNAADAAAAAAVADARRYAKLAGAAADAAESAQVELARRDRRISDLESQHDDVHRLAQLETERATADTNAARDVLQEENALLRDDVDRSETRLKAQFEIERRLRSVVAELRSQGTAAAESGALERRRPPADQAPAADARRHALADKEQELRYVEGELLGLSRHYEKKYDVASAHLEADNARLKASLSALSQKHESAADQLRLAANAAGEAARSHESLRGQVDALTRQRDALAKRLAKLEADAKADICPY